LGPVEKGSQKKAFFWDPVKSWRKRREGGANIRWTKTAPRPESISLKLQAQRESKRKLKKKGVKTYRIKQRKNLPRFKQTLIAYYERKSEPLVRPLWRERAEGRERGTE